MVSLVSMITMEIFAVETVQNRNELSFTEYTANEANVSAQIAVKDLMQLSTQVCKEEDLSATEQQTEQYFTRAAIESIDQIVGGRYTLMHVYSNSVYTSHTTVATQTTVVKKTNTQVTLKGFIFGGTAKDITATVDLATGEVSIKSQAWVDITGSDGTKIGTGNICKMNVLRNTYDSKAEIKGHIVGNSIVIDDNIGCFITTGANAGLTVGLGFIEYTAITPLNGNVVSKSVTFENASENGQTTANRKVTDQKTSVFAYPVGKDILRIMNVPVQDKYSDLNVKLSPDGTMSIAPQLVSSNTFYGDVAVMVATEKVDATGKVTYSISPVATIGTKYDAASKTITTNPYAVVNASGSAMFGYYEGTTVTLNDDVVSFPETVKFNLEGSGTKEDPWLIKHANDFYTLSQDILTNTDAQGNKITEGSGSDVEVYYNVYSGKYFKLANDIDFDSIDAAMNPIGNKTYRFAGILDGNKKTIKNLTYLNYAFDFCGLFGVLGSTAAVHDITFENPQVLTLGYTAGVLAGISYATISNITITNPIVRASVGYNTGALVGYSYGKIDGVNITNARVTALGYVGGAVGRSYNDINNVHVTGSVSMPGKQVFGGGLVGQAIKVTIDQQQPIISNCSFSGTISSSSDEIGLGGLAGALSYTKLTSSFASAQVIAISSKACYVGGLVGTAFDAEVSDCYVAGYVRNPNSADVGGLVGHITKSTSTGTSNPVTITNCYSSAMLATGSTEATAAFIGQISGATVTNCYFDKQIAPISGLEGGKLTSELTTANGLEGFSTDTWLFTEGLYPRIKAAADNDAAAVSSAPLTLAARNTINEITENFKYSTANNVGWMALVNDEQNTEGGYAFGFSNGEGVLNTSQHTDTIFALRGSASKYYIVNIAPVLFEGEGTAENPWQIKNEADFKLFSKITVDATMAFEDKYFVLTSDLDFKGDTIVPVCKSKTSVTTPSNPFMGVFDGQGHTIDNYVILGVGFFTADNTTGTAVPGQVNPKSENSYYNSGLFAALGTKGVIKNLNIGSKAILHSFNRGGAFVGHSTGLVENCANYGTVCTYFSISGGIVGYLNGGKVVNSYNNGGVYTNANTVGGIVGEATAGSVISGCENTGEIAAYWFNPYQKEGSQYGAGGIAGTVTSATINNVINSGSVWSNKQVGGIVSKVSGTAAKPCVVENALNYGYVTANKEKISLGKIAGMNTLGTFKNCIADAQIQKAGLVANGNFEGTTALATDSITCGKISLPDSAFNLTAGAYPVLKYYTEVPAQVQVNSKAVLLLAKGQYANAVFSNATLSSNVQWDLMNKAVFSIDGTTLKVMEINAGCFTDTLVATSNGATRKLSLATLNLNPAFLEGEGTAQSPFIITDPMEFINVAKFINQYGFDYEGYYFKVKNDLDFNNIEFVPVNAFAGSFDGNGKQFANVKYEADVTDKTAIGRALFGTLNSAGSIKGIILDKNSSINAYNFAGGIVSYLYGKITDCTNNAKVTTYGTTNAGGIAAIAYPGAEVANCVNAGIVTSKTSYAGGVLGSTAAQAKITLDGCTNKGSVTGTTKVGGLAGSASANITNGVNEGYVNATTNYAGGVIGEALLPSSITDSKNAGEVTGPQYIGGIFATAAAHTAAKPFVVDKCSNSATIKVGAKGWAGGIACTVKAGSSITNCFNTGSIEGSTSTSTNIRIAGIISDAATSKTAPTTITDCYNTGDITCFSNSGGVVGYMSGDSAVFKNCYNVGNITGGGTASTANNIGGILGNGDGNFFDCWNSGDIMAPGKQIAGIRGNDTMDSLQITTRCANFGDITSTGSGYVGGIVGNGRGRVISCYNFGTISAPKDLGGIVGWPGNAASPLYTMTIANCYNAGEILTNGSNTGNIASKNASMRYLVLRNNYYDTSVNETYDNDEKDGITGVTSAELVAADLGADFVKAEATYPSLKDLVENETNSFFTATILLDADKTESFDHISKKFLIGTPKGAVWTATGNLTISGNTVTPDAKEDGEKATLTLTVGERTRTYDLVLYKYSGINDVMGDEGKEVSKVVYYLANGVQVASPEGLQQVVIEQTTYTDGTSKVRKYVPAK